MKALKKETNEKRKLKGKGTRYLTSEVPLLSREYSPRKPTVRSFYEDPKTKKTLRRRP